MFGNSDKRVTVRFTKEDFAKYEKLLQRMPSLGKYNVGTWTRLIHLALRELYNKYDTPEAAAKKKLPAVSDRGPLSDAKPKVPRKSALTSKRK